MEQALISALPMDAANDASHVMVPEAFVVHVPYCRSDVGNVAISACSSGGVGVPEARHL
jgi:hypothetical protein